MKKELFDELLESVEQMNQIARGETESSHLGTTKELSQEQLVRAAGLKLLRPLAGQRKAGGNAEYP